MIRVHAKRAWVGDYHILPQFISSVKLHVLVYCGLLCRWILYVVNLPQYHIHVHSFLVCILQTADILLKDYICKFFPNTLSEHQRTQDTLHTDEPAPNILSLDNWKTAYTKRSWEHIYTLVCPPTTTTKKKKKTAATLKVHKWHTWNVCVRLVKGLYEPYQSSSSASISNRTVNFSGKHH